MVVVTFNFYEPFNNVATETILANTKEDAEDLLRTLKSKTKDLKIEYFFIIAKPTFFSVFSRDENGNVLVINWKDEERGTSGRVRVWTELPSTIKNNKKED